MVGRDGLKLLLLWMVGRFGCKRGQAPRTGASPLLLISPQTQARSTGDMKSFDFGEEVGDDVVGVGGVEEASGGEVGCQEVKQRAEVLRAGVDGGELH
jgi:hypothetical protein